MSIYNCIPYRFIVVYWKKKRIKRSIVHATLNYTSTLDVLSMILTLMCHLAFVPEFAKLCVGLYGKVIHLFYIIQFCMSTLTCYNVRACACRRRDETSIQCLRSRVDFSLGWSCGEKVYLSITYSTTNIIS